MKTKRKRWPIFLLLVSFLAIAGIVTINAANAPYKDLSNVKNTNIYTDFEIKVAAGHQIASTYRLENGISRLPQGSQFKVIWKDGSSEKFIVISKSSSAGTEPLPGTQQVANGGSGGGGGFYPPGSGENPFADCFSEPVTGCTRVGGGQQYCETFTVLNCPGI